MTDNILAMLEGLVISVNELKQRHDAAPTSLRKRHNVDSDGNSDDGDVRNQNNSQCQTTKAHKTLETAGGPPVLALAVPPELRKMCPIFGGVPDIAVKLEVDCMDWTLKKLLIESVKCNIDLMSVSNYHERVHKSSVSRVIVTSKALLMNATTEELHILAYNQVNPPPRRCQKKMGHPVGKSISTGWKKNYGFVET
eukprot:scaffold93591_cov49-Attheya_sp.AAC.1